MKQILILFLLLVAVLSIDIAPLSIDDISQDEIQVTVSGAVEHEGTLVLDRYATVQDALDEAKPLDNADVSSLNPLMILSDQDVLVVPEFNAESAVTVSINTGTLEELDSLPGIGPSTAQSIIDYRNANGLFQTIEDIMNVKGIGEAKFEKMKEMITLSTTHPRKGSGLERITLLSPG